MAETLEGELSKMDDTSAVDQTVINRRMTRRATVSKNNGDLVADADSFFKEIGGW